jgi:hypothetical protein
LLPDLEEGEGDFRSKWADCGATGRKLLGRRDGNQRKKVSGRKERLGRNQGRIDWAAKKYFQFSNKDLSSKVKDLNIFKLDLNRDQTKIDSNKLFKISLNIQIQTLL